MMTRMASASSAPFQAAFTIARSRRRLGEKMPGVSTKMICVLPRMAIPRMGIRVVCTLRVTIETFCPTRAFNRVDLPAFGAPRMATNPQRVSSPFESCFAPLMSKRPIETTYAAQRPVRPHVCWGLRRFEAQIREARFQW